MPQALYLCNSIDQVKAEVDSKKYGIVDKRLLFKLKNAIKEKRIFGFYVHCPTVPLSILIFSIVAVVVEL